MDGVTHLEALSQENTFPGEETIVSLLRCGPVATFLAFACIQVVKGNSPQRTRRGRTSERPGPTGISKS